MRKNFELIGEIIKQDTVDPSAHLNKMTEEVGEVAKEVNRLSGRKKRDGLSDEQIAENIEEELCDVIQTCFAIAHCCNISFDSLDNTLKRKNKKYKNVLKLK